MRGFEQIPFLYDAILALAEWTGLKRWREWLCGGTRGRVLDLGCGTGRNLPLLPPGSGWAILFPEEITNRNQVVGIGQLNGLVRGFVMQLPPGL